MNTSPTVSKIIPALLAAQKQIAFAAKDATNPHFKSKYADLPAVVDAIKEPLNNNGIFFSQPPCESPAGSIGIETILFHESGEWISGVAHCPLAKNDPQGYGSAQTYLRRYSLGSIVGLYSDVDDDGNAASVKQQSAPKHEPVKYSANGPLIKPETLAAINALCANAAMATKATNALAAKGLTEAGKLSEEDAQKFLAYLKK